jgi:hypothetical protein
MSADPQAMATTGTLAQANLFDLTGPITINYSRSSITGVPLLSYQDSQLNLQFSATEIDRTATPIGELVTVTLENVVDAYVRTFTLLVPEIRLRHGDEAEFDTLGIETTDRSGAFVPAPGPAGVLHTYRVHQMHGTAQLVNF